MLKRIRKRGAAPLCFLVHPRAGSSWFRNILDANSKLCNAYEFTHEGVEITWQGTLYRPPLRLHRYKRSRVVCLIRDPRDIAVSLFYFCRYRQKNVKIRPAHFIRTQVPFISRYYAAIADASKTWLSGIHWVHYADAVRDTVGEFEKIYKFWGVESEDLEQVVEEFSFGNMQDVDKTRRISRQRVGFKFDFKGDMRTLQVRRGQIGEWRTLFAESQLPPIPAWMVR